MIEREQDLDIFLGIMDDLVIPNLQQDENNRQKKPKMT